MIKVPHEIVEKLKIFQRLVIKWNKAVNLISDNSIQDFWQRHILDSLQLMQYIYDKEIHLIDIGSGSGFPGMVLSIAGLAKVSLIESDLRKCIFLEKVAKISDNNVQIINRRIEKVEMDCNILTCRAFSNLSTIFNCVKNISVQEKFLLLKGQNYLTEVVKAKENWSFDYLIHQSITFREGKILEVSNLTKII